MPVFLPAKGNLLSFFCFYLHKSALITLLLWLNFQYESENEKNTNDENVARDVGISGVNVREWYRIFVDTLIGFEDSPYKKTKIRKPNASSKFYLFDVGVTRKL